MKKIFSWGIIISFCLISNLNAQVTIGSGASPDANAVLDLISQTKKGLLLPKVSLTATNDKSPMSANKVGMVVYNTATTSGTYGVTPGYYYNDGSGWLRISYSTEADGSPDSWLNDATNSFVKLATKSDGYSTRSSDAGVVLTDGGKLGVGNTTPNAKADFRTNTQNKNTPGDGYIGLGDAKTISAATAGAGAIRYSVSDGGLIEYSNGTTWNSIPYRIQRSLVVAKKQKTNQTFYYNVQANVTYWDEVVDVNGDFEPTTGIFTAPRDGAYIITFGFDFVGGAIATGSKVEAILVHTDAATSTSSVRRTVCAYPKAGTTTGGSGALISFSFYLKKGDTVNPAIFYNLSTTGRQLKVYSTVASDDGFVNFSVKEL